MKKVSVVIPVYNMEKSIAQGIENLLKQTYENIEIILIDDGSTDGSLDICLEYAKKDNRIRVLHTENQGSGLARNAGIAEATGDFIYFPDADDLVEPSAIDILIRVVETANCDLVVFGYKIVNSKNKVMRTKQYPKYTKNGDDIRRCYEVYCGMDQLYSIQGAPWNKFFNLDIIKKNNIWYPALRRHQDEVFISRYVEHTIKVCFIPDVLYSYYSNDLNKVWDKYPKDYLDIIIALRQYRMDTMAKWNSQNSAVLNIIGREFICNFIKALELSFSKKMNFNYRERLAWIKEATNKLEKKNTLSLEESLMFYQKYIMTTIHNKKYGSLYIVLFIKVFIEKNFHFGIRLIKKVLG